MIALEKNKLGVVACYFNPQNYLSKYINFLDFYTKIKSDKNIDILVVESIQSNSVYPLKNVINENILSVQTNSVYWQKEELINLGFKKFIQNGHKTLCWLDADIEFLNSSWSKNIVEELISNDVIQVFEKSHEVINPSSDKIDHNSFVKKIKNGNNNPFRRIGEIGYGYAYKSNIIENGFLYENAVVGGGDFLNIIPFIEGVCFEDIKNDRYFQHANEEMVEDYKDWFEKKEPVKIGYAKNTIRVEFHGDRKNRNYLKREQILKNLNFCPQQDFEYTNTHSTRNLKNKKLEDYLKKYFKERNEDYFLNDKSSKRYFKKIINKIADSLNLPTDKSMLEVVDSFKTKNQKSKIEALDIKKNRLCVWSKNNIKEINLSSFDFVQNIIYDKSDRLQLNSIQSPNHDRFPQTYLKFIIQNYNNLPSVILFCNDNTDQSIILNKLDNLKNIPNDENLKYTQIVENTEKIRLDNTGHIVGLYKKTNVEKSKFTFEEWNNHFGKSKIGFEYYKNPNFYIGRNTIKKNNVEFYTNLLNNISGKQITENELYLNRSWINIFES